MPAKVSLRSRFLTLFAIALGLSVTAAHTARPPATPTEAAVAAPPGEGTTYTGPYFEHGIAVRSGEVVDALGPNLMGDSVNEYTGGVQFTHTDVSLPGNNALPVGVGRTRSLGSSSPGNGLFGDWSLDLPHVRTVATQKEPNWYGASTVGNLARCSQFAEPPRTSSFHSGQLRPVFAHSFWDGYQLSVPGQGAQTMLKRDAIEAGVLIRIRTFGCHLNDEL